VVLKPSPSPDALTALAAQLSTGLRAAAPGVAGKRWFIPPTPACAMVTIRLAVEMLGHADPRRREDASYILGGLAQRRGFDRHMQLLQWDFAAPEKTDWAVWAQAADSLGRIGDTRAATRLLELVKPAPDRAEENSRRAAAIDRSGDGNALVACGRLGISARAEESSAS
jgi:hypothetical protein